MRIRPPRCWEDWLLVAFVIVSVGIPIWVAIATRGFQP